MGQSVKLPKVFVQPPTLGADTLFRTCGFPLMSSPAEADWIVLCGGEDINPKYYNERPTKYCPSWNVKRDEAEFGLVEAFRGRKTFVGICRGAQLLNIAAGGRLWQHVDNHAGPHHHISVINGATPQRGMVNSVHHQMMRTAKGGLLLGWSYHSMKRISETEDVVRASGEIDPEIVWYPKEKFFCFQGHPEFGHPETSEIFFRSLFNSVPAIV